EFWNRTVDRELRVDGGKTYTPFPVLDASIDDRRGRLVGPQPSDYLVLASDEIRFGLAASTSVARTPSLRLRRAERPYRLLWVTRGLTGDGWLLPGKRATVRLFGSRVEPDALRHHRRGRDDPRDRRPGWGAAAGGRHGLPSDRRLRGRRS